MIYQTKSLLGLRDSNEDEIDIVFNYEGDDKEKKTMNYYAVYDGHGGNNISRYIKERLNKYFMNKRCSYDIKKKKDMLKYINGVYTSMQNKIMELNLKSRSCGSTALVVIQYEKSGIFSQLKIINLGDCRAVLCDQYNRAVQLTKDHKPMAFDENRRITALGGTIIHDHDDDPRINGLSVSRAFGDVEAKPHVSHMPEVFDHELAFKNGEIIDKFLIIACDGVWDVLSSQEAVDFVLYRLTELNTIQTCNGKGSNNIAHMLGKHAIHKGSTDNISIAIIFF